MPPWHAYHSKKLAPGACDCAIFIGAGCRGAPLRGCTIVETFSFKNDQQIRKFFGPQNLSEFTIFFGPQNFSEFTIFLIPKFEKKSWEKKEKKWKCAPHCAACAPHFKMARPLTGSGVWPPGSTADPTLVYFYFFLHGCGSDSRGKKFHAVGVDFKYNEM